jgi:hypothetical protein
MAVNGFQQFLLNRTKGKICMYDIFGNCDKEDCFKEHLQGVQEKNFLKTLLNNPFDSSIVRKLPFYISDDKFINNNEEMNKYIKKKGIVDKADIRFEICKCFKTDLLKIGNKIGKFSEPKTRLSVCSRQLFMPYCNNHKAGNYVTVIVKYPDDTISSIDLCYSDKHYLSICNCDVEIFQSKKNKRYYVKDIFKVTKSTGASLSHYVKGATQDTEHKSYERAQRKEDPNKKFTMKDSSFPSMKADEEVRNIELKKWGVKAPAEFHVTPLELDDTDDTVDKGPQREISSGSLSEMGSPIKLEIKEFKALITTDLTKIESNIEFIELIDTIKVEYNKARHIAIQYYEKYQTTVIYKDSNESNYKLTICDLKKNLEKQHLEQMSYLDDFSDMSDSESDTSLNDEY